MEREGQREDGPSLRVPVEGALAEALAAALAAAEAESQLLETSPGAGTREEARALREGMERLLGQAIAHALGAAATAPVGTRELDEAAARLRERICAALDEPGHEPPPLEAAPPERLEFLTEMLRERALEEESMVVALAHGGGGAGLVLLGAALPDEAASAWLQGDVLDKVWTWATTDPLRILETLAARWWLSRWRGADEDDLASRIREREWLLAARPFLAERATAVQTMEAHGALDELPPRQRHLARQMAGAEADVWKVRTRDGARAEFRSLSTGERRIVAEHQPSQGYGPGALGIGRLIPHGDGTWLRSQGMVVVPYREGASEKLQGMLEKVWTGAAGGSQAALLLEAVVHGVLQGQRLPREVPPAPGPAEAAKLLGVLYPLLERAGRMEPRRSEELGPDELGVVLESGPFAVDVDDVVRDWIQALSAVAESGGKKGQKKRG